MKKKVKQVATASKKELVKYTPNEAKDILMKIMKAPSVDLEYSLELFGENILSKFTHGNPAQKKEAKEELYTKGREIMLMLEVDTHWNLAEAFNDQYRGMVVELTSQIIKEYDCITHAEKMLAEIIANAYTRVLDASRRLNNDLGKPGTEISENKTKYLLMLSKLHDRANREFLNALIALKQLKAPTIEMNIKANTAFIAQNQQNNASQPEHETVDP